MTCPPLVQSSIVMGVFHSHFNSLNPFRYLIILRIRNYMMAIKICSQEAQKDKQKWSFLIGLRQIQNAPPSWCFFGPFPWRRSLPRRFLWPVWHLTHTLTCFLESKENLLRPSEWGKCRPRPSLQTSLGPKHSRLPLKNQPLLLQQGEQCRMSHALPSAVLVSQ